MNCRQWLIAGVALAFIDFGREAGPAASASCSSWRQPASEEALLRFLLMLTESLILLFEARNVKVLKWIRHRLWKNWPCGKETLSLTAAGRVILTAFALCVA